MSDIFDAIEKALENRESFVIATMLEKQGSAPREQGTKMLIKADYSIVGTIGGGLLEALTIKSAAKVLQSKESIVEDYILSNKDAAATGMVCGGSVRILLEFVSSEEEGIAEVYRRAIELKQQFQDFIMISRLPEPQGQALGFEKWICTETGFYGFENDELQQVTKEIREGYANIRYSQIIRNERRYLIEPFIKYDKLHIVGGGHIAQTIADLAKKMDFYVEVIDDREEFANRERFNTADELKVISSFDCFTKYVNIDNNSYIVIVTRGHLYDKEVLAQALKTDAKYIGMIGSKNKREHVYSSLLEEGFNPEDLERVKCPIGLSINADTPVEIAVSIAAEIIQFRKGSLK